MNQEIHDEFKATKVLIMLFLFLFLGMFAVACDRARPTQPIKTVTKPERFEIELIGVVEDEFAYNGQRGIYLIKDKITGKEYLGVSGVGVSELGSHMVGKAPIQDER